MYYENTDLYLIEFLCLTITQILFHMARFYEPSVIFIDEFEGLASNRSAAGEHEASKRFKNELLMQIDQLDSEQTNVLLLASSNLPW